MRIAMFVLLAVAWSCSSPTDGDPRNSVGTIAGYFDDDPYIEVEVIEGTVHVSVATFVLGPGCFVRGETRVVVTGQRAEITPYNRFVGSGGACPLLLMTIEHEAELNFASSGPGEVIVHGRRRTVQPPSYEAIQVLRQVDVP